jgi:hypothetical protein
MEESTADRTVALMVAMVGNPTREMRVNRTEETVDFPR